jgi:glycosyltransferase involved in cell wall biosynthesis
MEIKEHRKPKLLYVVGLMPCPPEIGAHHRILNIGRQLKKYSEVTAVYIGPACESHRIWATEQELGKIHLLQTHESRMPGLPGRMLYKMKYHWPWFYGSPISNKDRERFFELCRQHDLLWFHTLTPADSIGRFRFENALLDLDDVNQIKHRQMGQASASWKQKTASALLAYKWRRREHKAKDRFTHLAVCSEEDLAYIGNPEQTVVIPNGFNPPETEPVWQEKQNKILGFVGFVGYTPNRHGLEWFAQKVWPKVLEGVPQARVRIMGHMPEPERFAKYKNLDILGFVQDAAVEMSQWSALIVPILIGGGTRLKILDAFSKKCPVVSTRIGAHGLKICPDKNILLADDANAFAGQCIRLLKNPSLGQAIAEEGWKLFLADYTWDRIGEKIKTVLEQMMSKKLNL